MVDGQLVGHFPVEQKSRLKAMVLVLVAGMLLSHLFVAMAVRNFFPIHDMSFETAAQTLGIPMTNGAMAGVEFVVGRKEGDQVNMVYRCLNCGYTGPTWTLTYPKKPGAGWRGHDFPDDANLISMAQAQEVE